MTAKRPGRKGGSRTAPTWHDADELRWAVRHWATRLGVRAPQIHLRQMRSKWASISTAGRLTLNTDLLAIPKDLGEFVVVHELVHLLAPNHGKLFKSFMRAYMPDWEEQAERLRRVGRIAEPLSSRHTATPI
jgi:predicted metal-dependent hydrolase